MLRVIFTAEDLARVHVAPGPDLLWEIANSVQTLQRRDGAPAFGTWRQSVRPRLSRDSRQLAALLPPRGYSPDFLTPADSTTGTARADADSAQGTDAADALEAAVDTVLSTPRHRLGSDVGRLAAGRDVPRWVVRLGQGELASLRTLGTALRSYHAEAVAPYWPRVRAHTEADRLIRLRILLDGGTESLLASFAPQIRWRPPVLEVDYPVEQTLHLGGRGLTLQPSFFCWPAPVTLADPGLPPVLVYPVRHDRDGGHPACPQPAPQPDALGALMGSNRAAVLTAARTGCTTGEVARRLGISNPAVSQHLAVLRHAGLLISVRHADRTLHIATPEGRALLDSAERGSLQ